MEDKEDKGFVVKDRRRFSLDGEGDQEEPREEADRSEQPQDAEGAERAEPTAGQEAGDTAERADKREWAPLPQVTFSTFTFSLSSSALVHLGDIPDPETQQVSTELALAKQIIDTLGMLEEKTRGNLDPDEERLLKSVLYDLRLRYIEKSSKR